MPPADRCKCRRRRQEATRHLSPPAVYAAGDNGNYIVSVNVSYEDGRIACEIPVRFLISKFGKPAELYDTSTDTRGFATLHLTFSEPECVVTVLVPGWEHRVENLYGPPRHKRIVIPEPTVADLEGPLRQMIKRAWRGELVDRKKKEGLWEPLFSNNRALERKRR